MTLKSQSSQQGEQAAGIAAPEFRLSTKLQEPEPLGTGMKTDTPSSGPEWSPAVNPHTCGQLSFEEAPGSPGRERHGEQWTSWCTRVELSPRRAPLTKTDSEWIRR